MANNTGNPVPSANVLDFQDNAQNFDTAVNSNDSTWTDRLGVTRSTLNGQIEKARYQIPIDYASGIAFTSSDKSKTVDYNGVIYAPLPSAIPFTTSGTFETDKFYAVQGLSKSAFIGYLGELLGGYTNYSFSSVANLKAGTTSEGDITDELKALIDSGDVAASTLGYYGTYSDSETPSGGANYILTTLARARAEKGVSWAPDTYGNHYLFGGTDYVAVLNESENNASYFGAIADGVSDNVDFFNFVESSGLTILFEKGNYATSGSLNLTNGTRLNGNNSTITLLGGNALGVVGTDSYIGEFIIDGLDGEHTPSVLSIASPSENAHIGKMRFQNFLGTNNFQTYCIVIPMYGASNFKVDDSEHYNIRHEDNGSVTGRGFVGGIYLMGLNSQVSNGKSYGQVGDVYGQDIKTVEGTGGAPVQDSDLVRAFAETNTDETFDIIFGNITGRDVGKRLVKGASCAGITFGDCFSYVSDIVDGGLPMHATVECLSSAIGWKFGRIGNEGPNTRVVWFQGCTGCECGDIYNGWGSIAALFGGVAAETTNCKVGDITGRDRPDGDQDGTGVYYYFADGCTTGCITGDYEWSVRCNNDANVGRNVVGDVNANGKIDLTYGQTTLGKVVLDVTKTSRIERPVVLGGKFKLTNTEIFTDGARTVDIVGAIDGDLGNLKIYRVSNSGGISTDVALLTTEGGAVSGRLKGSVYVEVQNAILGTPVVDAKHALVYLNDLIGLDLDKLHVNITSPTRGSTGYNCWIDDCQGYIANFLVRSSYNATSVIDGDITVDKAVNFTANGILNLTTNVALFQAEKLVSGAINGAVNTPVIINVTRP